MEFRGVTSERIWAGREQLLQHCSIDSERGCGQKEETMATIALSRNAGESCPKLWVLQVPMLEPGDRQRTFELAEARLLGSKQGIGPDVSIKG